MATNPATLAVRYQPIATSGPYAYLIEWRGEAPRCIEIFEGPERWERCAARARELELQAQDRKAVVRG
jgi:hypothetical protein